MDAWLIFAILFFLFLAFVTGAFFFFAWLVFKAIKLVFIAVFGTIFLIIKKLMGSE